MDWEWKPVQEDLGALGATGICYETSRVVRRTIFPTNRGGLAATFLTVLCLAQVAADRTIGSSDLGFGIVAFAYHLTMFVCAAIINLLSIYCTAAYALRVATLYCTDGDSGASDRMVRNLPIMPLMRLLLISITVLPLANFYITMSALAWLDLPQLDPSDKAVVLALQLLGGAVLLAGASYVAVLSHIVIVVALLEELEEDSWVGTVRKSRALLAGKFWAAAVVFIPLDSCFVAIKMYFPDLVFGNALGLGRTFQVAAGLAMAVALWVVAVVTLVAQPVVYLVCKNHHNEVVDKVHLNYVGEYQQLDIGDSDSGVELQQVMTELNPETAQSPGAGSSST